MKNSFNKNNKEYLEYLVEGYLKIKSEDDCSDHKSYSEAKIEILSMPLSKLIELNKEIIKKVGKS